jgi:hypothetical protein
VADQAQAPRLRHRILSERVERLRHDPHLVPWRDRVEWVRLEGEPFDGASSPRLARLRDAALRHVKEEFVGFLDDDNAIEQEHIASLYALIKQRRLDAAHSWRSVLNADGSPFLFYRYPWHNDVDIATRMYRLCVAHGTIVPGDPVMRDGIRAAPGDGAEASVDMNEWLFRTEQLRRIGFDLEFSQSDMRHRIGEDDKLYCRILADGLRFACSERPTVRYYLGGVSNLRLTSGPTTDTICA